MALELLDTMPVSSRLVVKIMEVVGRYLPGIEDIPVHGTICNWQNKSNFHRLMKSASTAALPGSEQDSWALIIDVSISFGGQRILLVVGVRLRDYSQGLPLTYNDVKVLSIGLQYQSWTGAKITELLKCEVLSTYQVSYIVSDGGKPIVKAVADLGLARVEDCSHAFALLLQRVYANNERYQAFEAACTLLKRQGSISRYANILPPKVRSHSRFMNVGSLVKWAIMKLAWLDEPTDMTGRSAHLSAVQRSKLLWLLDFRELIQQLDTTMSLIDTILRGLKSEGVSEQTKEWVDNWVSQPMIVHRVHACIRRGIARYMERQLAVAKQINKEWVLCSSDVVESLFGRHKYHRYGPTRHGPAFMRLAGYGRATTCIDEIIRAMEATTNRSLRTWIKKKLKRIRQDGAVT